MRNPSRLVLTALAKQKPGVSQYFTATSSDQVCSVPVPPRPTIALYICSNVQEHSITMSNPAWYKAEPWLVTSKQSFEVEPAANASKAIFKWCSPCFKLEGASPRARLSPEP